MKRRPPRVAMAAIAPVGRAEEEELVVEVGEAGEEVVVAVGFEVCGKEVREEGEKGQGVRGAYAAGCGATCLRRRWELEPRGVVAAAAVNDLQLVVPRLERRRRRPGVFLPWVARHDGQDWEEVLVGAAHNRDVDGASVVGPGYCERLVRVDVPVVVGEGDGGERRSREGQQQRQRSGPSRRLDRRHLQRG